MPSDHGLAEQQYNNVWATTPATGVEEELTTPTGQTCRAKKMSIEAMIGAGLLAESDAITAQVAKHMKKVKPGGKQPKKNAEPDIDVVSLMKDPSAVNDLVSMLDHIMPHIVVSPPVALHYTETTVGKTKVTKAIPEEAPEGQPSRQAMREERPGLVFTDQIGIEDKMWLFDWSAGGLGTMLAFRQ